MIIIADNIHIMNPMVHNAVKDLEPKPIMDIAKRSEHAGAHILDINPGPLLKEPEKKMRFLVESVQGTTDIQLSLDTNNPIALEAGLLLCQKKPIINGVSIEPGKLSEILPLAKKYETDIIGFLLTDKGQVPRDSEERLDIALRLIDEVQNAGIGIDNLIIDPIAVPMMWEDGSVQAKEVLLTIKHLDDLVGKPIRKIIGLSNLTSGSTSKDKSMLLEQVYLTMLAQSGLDMVLMNVDHETTLRVVRIYDLIDKKKILSWGEI